MSPSRNFPARAEPSYQGSELSRAGALQFPSWKQADNKVHIFWEDHKIFQNLHLTFVWCTVDKIKAEIWQNFVAFSEYTNFTDKK